MLNIEYFFETNNSIFKSSIDETYFGNVFLSEDVDFIFDAFYNRLYEIYYKYFPIRKKKRLTHKNSLWVTSGLKYCIRKKYKFLKLHRRNKICKVEFLQYKRLLNSAIK